MVEQPEEDRGKLRGNLPKESSFIQPLSDTSIVNGGGVTAPGPDLCRFEFQLVALQPQTLRVVIAPAQLHNVCAQLAQHAPAFRSAGWTTCRVATA